MLNKQNKRCSLLLCFLIMAVSPLLVAANTGDVYFIPDDINVDKDDSFEVNVVVDTGVHLATSFGIIADYPEDLLGVDYVINSDYTIIYNDRGTNVFVSGFSTTGQGPSPELELFTIGFTAIDDGTDTMTVSIDILTDEDYKTLGGTPTGFPATVVVNP